MVSQVQMVNKGLLVNIRVLFMKKYSLNFHIIENEYLQFVLTMMNDSLAPVL